MDKKRVLRIFFMGSIHVSVEEKALGLKELK